MRLKLAPPRTQHSDMVTALCWTPFNEMYSCSDDGTISKWDLDGEHQGKVCDLGTWYSARRTTPPQRQRLIRGPTSATYISPLKPTLPLRLLPNPHDTLSHVHRTCRVPHAFVGLRPSSALPQPCIAERSWSERGPAHSGSASNHPPLTLPLTQTRTPCPCIPLVLSLLRSVRRCVCSNTPPSIAPAPLFPLPPRSLRSHPPTSPSTPAPQTPS